ncbi:MAG: hypothetical protein U0236_15950 [Nitrospira sp.]
MDADEKHFRGRELRLERWKVFLSILTPLVLLFLTWVVNNAIQERGAALDREKQILSEKQKIYAEMGKRLNVIFVYVLDVGDFRAYKPPQIVDFKREVDRQFFSYRPYWSAETENNYNEFMSAAFQTYTGSGQPAKIRASRLEKVAASKVDKLSWDPVWDDYFTEEMDHEVSSKYYKLVSAMLNDTVTPGIRKVAP